MSVKNVFYAQSGGPTAVINASACGVIETARLHGDKIGKVYAGLNGILGALHENLLDTSLESAADIAALRYTPASAFGSCRFKLKGLEENKAQYERLIEVFKAHNIGYFFYNGGNDSQDTALKVSEMSKKMGYPLISIGIPKTIDNDLPIIDFCPGFGSVAKYVAVSTQEAALDTWSMAASSTKVFILEVMGRHAGWIAAAGGLGAEKTGDAPHLILFPEITFDKTKFLAKVDQSIKQFGYCVIVASEGIRDAAGNFLSDAGLRDAFGHAQLGGVAPVLANLIKDNLGYKYHWAVADYLQRAARHIASKVDAEQAYALGKAAVEHALQGVSDVMMMVERQATQPCSWKIKTVELSKVANQERKMPAEFISADGFGITQQCRDYLQPLIEGEDYPPYARGLPKYVKLQNKLVAKLLQEFVAAV